MNSSVKTVLIVDDEASIRRFLKINLQANGYAVVESDSIAAAQDCFDRTRPDLVILDLGLPDGDGASVLSYIKGKAQTPVMILSVKASDREKIRLLDAGADDYIAKPFSVDELAARLRVIFRRSSPSAQKRNFTFGSVKIDGDKREVFVENNFVPLTATEFDLLYYLAVNAGRVVTHDQLLRTVWGNSASNCSHYLRVYVAQIRKKLKQSAVIKTESGIGYRLIDTSS
jgi:two-component system KDP operon response regulator KdpE